MAERAQQPFITIVIPVYNRERLVIRTLDSVAAQRCGDFRLIVVDNASTDATRRVVSDWMAAHPAIDCRLLDEPTPGACAARNRGLQEVDTTWTLFFDSDDVMLPGHVERIRRLVQTHPDADVIGWNMHLNRLDGSVVTVCFWPDDPLYHTIFNGSMATQRYCARTEVFKRAGGWDNSVEGWNDIEIAVRMLTRGKLQMVHGGPEVTVVAYATRESITGTSLSSGADRYDHALDVMARYIPDSRRHWLEFKRARLAANCAREDASTGRRLLEKALGNTPSRWHRALWRVTYAYTRAGFRGIARLLRPVM